jgi:hypothetical protein
MFRGESKSKLLPENFGAGSFIIGSGDQVWMLVSDGKSSIRLLDLNTLVLTEKYYPVEDPNFLTQDEARRIVELTKLNWTFTDFELIPAGVKSKIISEAIRSVIEK